MGTRPELEIVNGELAGRRFKVPDGGLRLGRSSFNDIHIADEELSRSHCLFETVGSEGIRLTDLASANGTMLNGEMLGSDPVQLKPGDQIEVGHTVVKVVSEASAAGVAVDLGLSKPVASAAAGSAKRRSPVMAVLWVVALMAVAAAAYVLFVMPNLTPEEAAPAPVQDEDPPVREVSYEKVSADEKGIFRYELTYSRDGVLRVSVDDVPKDGHRVNKTRQLDEKSVAELNRILSFKAVREIDREFVGADPEPPSLESRTLKVVYETRVRRIRIVNTQEPEAFRAIREQLETFSKNELGIWAMQYSHDKLVALAEEAVRLGNSKWDEREVNHGNLFEAAAAYREALFYVETVNPKPACAAAAKEGLTRSTEMLDQRYRDQRFLADRAINLSQWDDARRQLLVLMEMIPDRNDDRHREASTKLLDVEKRLKKGGQ